MFAQYRWNEILNEYVAEQRRIPGITDGSKRKQLGEKSSASGWTDSNSSFSYSNSIELDSGMTGRLGIRARSFMHIHADEHMRAVSIE